MEYGKRLFHHGLRYGGSGLSWAAEILRRAIDDLSEMTEPIEWADAQAKLGIVLTSQAERAAGPESTELLRKALATIRAAQRVFVERPDLPNWAITQGDLGNVLNLQAQRVPEHTVSALLEEAEDAFRDALRIHSLRNDRLEWARALQNLAGVLVHRGRWADVQERVRLFKEAAEALDDVLTIFTEENLRQDWAMGQNNLGGVLRSLGMDTPGETGDEYFVRSARAYKNAHKVRTEDAHPVDWAITQYNLGNVLRTHGERAPRPKGISLLNEAITAYVAAQKVWTKEGHPPNWAQTKGNMGHAYEAISDNAACTDPQSALRHASQHHAEALTVFDKDHMPHDYEVASRALARVNQKLNAQAAGFPLDPSPMLNHVSGKPAAGERRRAAEGECGEMDLNTAQASKADLIKDGTEATFMADVVDASREVPVIVDFWAPWCGPCKTLTPALEAAVTAAKGKVRLVKVDVDQNQRIAAQMRVQSIPAVFGFVNGQPVDGFMGAQSPAQVKAFVDRLAQMGGGGDDGLAEALEMAEAMLTEGAVTDAAQTFAAILGEDETNVAALAGLARAHLALGDIEQAKAVLALAPADKQNDPIVSAARAQIELAEASSGAGEAAELAAAVERDPGDHQARFDLAMALVGEGRSEEAIEALLELFRRDREWSDAAAKTQLFKLFDSLGPKSEAAQKGRRRLSSMIFA